MTGDLNELDKIDLVRERTGLSYTDARQLLVEANWDVLDALVINEKESEEMTNEFEAKGSEVIDKVKKLIKDGSVTRIRVKNQGKTIVDIPVNVGLVGAVLAPKLALLGAATCMLTKCTIEFQRAGEGSEVEPESENGYPNH